MSYFYPAAAWSGLLTWQNIQKKTYPKKSFTYPKINFWTILSLQSDWLTRVDRNEVRLKMKKTNFSISPSQLCSHTPSALNAGAKRSGSTCPIVMPQCCYLANGAKRLSHTTNMLSIFRVSETFCFFGKVKPDLFC